MIIYKITNLLNGKSYIGQTIGTLKNRFNKHCRSNSAIGLAIKKYGVNAFSTEVLCSASSKDELNSLESEMITKFNTISPHGYNLKSGGNQLVIFSDETKNKMKKSHKRVKTFLGRSHSRKSKDLISFKLKGNIPWNKGKSTPSYVRDKISKSAKGRLSWNKGTCKYKVLGPEIEFNSVQEASSYFNVTNSAILMRCKRSNDWKLVPNE